MTVVSAGRLARLRQGLTLDVLALRVGIDRSVLSRAERGLYVLKPDVKRRLRKALRNDAAAVTDPA